MKGIGMQKYFPSVLGGFQCNWIPYIHFEWCAISIDFQIKRECCRRAGIGREGPLWPQPPLHLPKSPRSASNAIGEVWGGFPPIPSNAPPVCHHILVFSGLIGDNKQGLLGLLYWGCKQVSLLWRNFGKLVFFSIAMNEPSSVNAAQNSKIFFW